MEFSKTQAELANQVNLANDSLLKFSLAKWLTENKASVFNHILCNISSPDEDLNELLKFIESKPALEFSGASTNRPAKAEKAKTKKSKTIKKRKLVIVEDTSASEQASEQSVEQTPVHKKRSGRPKKERTPEQLAEEAAKVERKLKREKKKARRAANADKPKRIPCGYMLWLNEARPKIKSGIEDKSVTSVTKKAAEIWKTFTQQYRDYWTEYRLNLVAERDGDADEFGDRIIKFEKPVVFAGPVRGLVDYESDEE